jgi:hypothetical protein
MGGRIESVHRGFESVQPLSRQRPDHDKNAPGGKTRMLTIATLWLACLAIFVDVSARALEAEGA